MVLPISECSYFHGFSNIWNQAYSPFVVFIYAKQFICLYNIVSYCTLLPQIYTCACTLQDCDGFPDISFLFGCDELLPIKSVFRELCNENFRRLQRKIHTNLRIFGISIFHVKIFHKEMFRKTFAHNYCYCYCYSYLVMFKLYWYMQVLMNVFSFLEYILFLYLFYKMNFLGVQKKCTVVINFLTRNNYISRVL